MHRAAARIRDRGTTTARPVPDAGQQLVDRLVLDVGQQLVEHGRRLRGREVVAPRERAAHAYLVDWLRDAVVEHGRQSVDGLAERDQLLLLP